MAGNALLYGIVGFIAGVIMSNAVRNAVGPMLPEGIEIPSFYANSYPAYAGTSSSYGGSVYERDYENANELAINHLPI